MMEANESEYNWELRKGSRLLGILTNCRLDWPWYFCQFEARAEFERHRSLFEEELRLLDASPEDLKEWGESYKKIENLGLDLISTAEEGPVVKEFMIHINGDEAWFRAIFEDHTSSV
jgi:hypothetical protein